MAAYQQVQKRARANNPGASNNYIRTVTCQQLLFISQWASNSVCNMDPQQREHFLTALTSWHEAQAEQALTGENSIKLYLDSPQFTDHLKQFWDAIAPTLYYHFLCRNPGCGWAPTEHLISTVHKIAGNATFAHQQGFSNNSFTTQLQQQLTTLWRRHATTHADFHFMCEPHGRSRHYYG